MSGILDLLSGPIGQQIISGVAKSTGQDSSKTSSVLAMGLPLLMKAMQRNASTPEGAQGLMGAMSKHNGGILENLGGLFDGGVDQSVQQDGGKILGHILGNKAQGVEQIIGQKTGIDSGAVGNILKTATPLLMGMLGQQTQQNGLSNASDLSGMLGGLLGGNESQGEQSFLEKILDADGDGSVIDDVAGMVLNQGGSKGGGLLGGVIGGLFGK